MQSSTASAFSSNRESQILNANSGSVTEPKGTPRTGKFDKHAGRKLKSSTLPGSYASPKKDEGKLRNRTTNEHASIEEIDQMLEADAFALLNIRKEINQSQSGELKKLRDKVLSAKQIYDAFHVANEFKERELQAIMDKYNNLLEVDKASVTTLSSKQEKMKDLIDQTNIVLEELSAEQRTIKMQNVMIKRLDEEISQCRVETSKAVVHVDHAKHDVAIVENNLQTHRQELLEQEQEQEKLGSTLKLRKEQRENKISMLHTLSVDGEQSIKRLQSAFGDSSAKRQSFSRSLPRKSISAANRKPSHSAGRQNNEENVSEDFESSSNIEVLAKRLTLTQVKDIAQRYTSQMLRMEKLRQLDVELRAAITHQQEKKKEFSDHLAHTLIKIQQLASSRQIYQEVDQKDFTLASASKEADDMKDRDFRLRLSIESLKHSIPRFLTKVTKVVHPKPNENQLADAILKLEDELTKLIKAIGQAIMKDATPDDLAVISQQTAAAGSGVEAQSEFARLQRMPGYSRLQRQLYFNLMTAQPDISDSNIRIENIGKVKNPKTISALSSSVGPPPSQASPRKKVLQVSNMARKLSSDSFNEEEPDDDASMDRHTIKNISKLIYERDYKVKQSEVNA